MRTVFFVVMRQLWAKKGLNAIAIVGVVLGVLTLVAVSGMLDGARDKFLSTILQVSPHVVMHGESPSGTSVNESRDALGAAVVSVVNRARSDRRVRIQRPSEVAEAVEHFDGVLAASVVVSGTAILVAGAQERPVELRGINPEKQERVTPLNAYVKPGARGPLSSLPDGILVGSLLAEQLGLRAGDRVACVAHGQKANFVVVGVFETNINAIDKGRVYANLGTAQTVLGKGTDVDAIEIRTADPEIAPLVSAQLENGFGYEAESWQEANANFLGLLAQQDVIVWLVIAALLAVGGFGILSVQIMIVSQKQRDIAILRSVGFRRADIITIFISQGLVLAAIGSVLGGLLGHVSVAAISRIPAGGGGGPLLRSDFIPMAEKPGTYVAGVVFALLVGALASSLPAWRASRVEPVDVLRGQL